MASRKARTRPDFEAWQLQCAKKALTFAGISDLLDDGDPYDIFEAMREAYANGMKPSEFVRETFSEDRDRQDHDDTLLEESLVADALEYE